MIPPDATPPDGQPLTRGLGLSQATAVNITQIVGAGVFATIPLILGVLPGPYALLAWLVAGALILFDGGLRTRIATFRSVLAPAGSLATLGVLVSSVIVAPVAVYFFQLNWIEGFLVGAMVASTDAAAVFFLMHARGLRLRPRVGATIEVESGTNDPFAIFLTIVLVEILLLGGKSWTEIASLLVRDGILAWGVAGAAGALLTVVWNYAVSTTLVWRAR